MERGLAQSRSAYSNAFIVTNEVPKCQLSLDVNAQLLLLDVNAQQPSLDINAQQPSLDDNALSRC
jgi:hypothetical protein